MKYKDLLKAMDKEEKKRRKEQPLLVNWEDATDKLAGYFVTHYFGRNAVLDMWWVADEVGGVLFINDYFFNVQDMVDYIRHKYTRKMMFEYYDYSLLWAEKGKTAPYNIATYKWFKRKKKDSNKVIPKLNFSTGTKPVIDIHANTDSPSDDGFMTSMMGFYALNDSFAGGVIGGNMVGGMIGDALNSSEDSDKDKKEESAYDTTDSYSSNDTSDYSSSDSSSSDSGSSDWWTLCNSKAIG